MRDNTANNHEAPFLSDEKEIVSSVPDSPEPESASEVAERIVEMFSRGELAEELTATLSYVVEGSDPITFAELKDRDSNVLLRFAPRASLEVRAAKHAYVVVISVDYDDGQPKGDPLMEQPLEVGPNLTGRTGNLLLEISPAVEHFVVLVGTDRNELSRVIAEVKAKRIYRGVRMDQSGTRWASTINYMVTN